MVIDLNDVINDGYKAAAGGVLLKNNPWSERDASVQHFSWRTGWLEYAAETM